MKTRFIISLATLTVVAGLIIACNKSNSATGGNNSNSTAPNNSTTQVETQADDESQVNTELNTAENDINNSLNTSAAFNGVGTTSAANGLQTDGAGGLQILYNLCDATVTTDTANGQRELIITYNGLGCAGHRTRTGVITISIPIGTHWKDKGAVVTVSIDNLKITRIRDQKTIIINGAYKFTNVTGGLLRDLASLGTITHTVTADNLTVQFADSATRTWSVAKQRVFTYNNGVVITTTGTHSDGTNNNVAVWGTTRFGNSFETLIVQPLVIEQDCDWRLTSGETETIRKAVTLDITYGLDSSGNPTSCPGTGYYYYKAVWTIGNKTYTFIAPY
ncbi:MAG TPA: hypothetical protein VHE34_12430 [Puia sp.]|uniref:hypothetical protein n=1 Tax=Puia sp. TaxID=2045100 RepID=UPI002B92C5BC|nr:hypothetical protein [Puia sp.]HVU96029.1 hypothetical protein [Puia sp.]